MEGGWGGGMYCLLEVPQGCSCQVNILQCTLEGIKTVVGKHIRWKLPAAFQLNICKVDRYVGPHIHIQVYRETLFCIRSPFPLIVLYLNVQQPASVIE